MSPFSDACGNEKPTLTVATHGNPTLQLEKLRLGPISTPTRVMPLFLGRAGPTPSAFASRLMLPTTRLSSRGSRIALFYLDLFRSMFSSISATLTGVSFKPRRETTKPKNTASGTRVPGPALERREDPCELGEAGGHHAAQGQAALPGVHGRRGRPSSGKQASHAGPTKHCPTWHGRQEDISQKGKSWRGRKTYSPTS